MLLARPLHFVEVFLYFIFWEKLKPGGILVMDVSILLEYGWVLLVLVILEGLLAADNALILAIIVKQLPEEQRKKALFYGLAGAFVFRFLALFAISYLVNIWQVQAIGALYLLFIAIHHIARKLAKRNTEKDKEESKPAGFWMTVLKVELADIAFAVDSILAAVALAVALPDTPLPNIGGLDGGKFLVIFIGGFAGLVIMRFAANIFVNLLETRPSLEIAAFMIVGWVGIKLAVFTLSHPALGVISEEFAHSTAWKITFYTILVSIAVGGWLISGMKKQEKGMSS